MREGRVPNSLVFFASLAPLPFPDVLCELLFFRIKTFGVGCEAFVNVSLSAERVLESLEQKGEGNDSMSSREGSENVRIKAREYSMKEEEVA